MKTLINANAQINRAKERGQARIVILALVCFSLGVGASALWFSRRPFSEVASTPDQQRQDRVALAIEPSVTVSAPPQPAEPIDPAAFAAVNRAIPNISLASMEHGTLVLRKAALAEFQQVVQELQARQKKAEQNFIEGQGTQSAEQQMIVAKELQQLQAEQMEKLKEIAANSKAQIDALKQLKGQSQ
jgi:hypothetical protein